MRTLSLTDASHSEFLQIDMNYYLITGTQLLVVLTFLIPESRANETDQCPPPQAVRCSRHMITNEEYVNVYSTRFCLNFLCETKTDGGGWIVIQRRVLRDVYFNRTWDEYKYGFGTTCGDHWLGNKYIHTITVSANYELRIDMEFQSKKYFAQYSDFYVDDEQDNYRLHISGFTGKVKDDLMRHNNLSFSTPDRDNDRADWHCSGRYMTGWWFDNCHDASLNGHFHLTDRKGFAVIWEDLTGNSDTLSSVEMKIRKTLK